MAVPFSLEAVILGRNDEYEPNWTENLYSVIAYNRARFEGSSVDFRVAFVEWNPPAGKPLLSPGLLERFPFLRAIVIEPEVHKALCTAPDLQIMINFGFNAGFRTCAADFTMTTCGDDFWGEALCRRIADEGLKPSHLYRAERVNVKRDLPFATIDPATLERGENIVLVDTCAEPPYNVPPYTRACGDFSLTDSGTMFAIGGMDEAVREARLHLDSRLCVSLMGVVEDCVMLGRINHITHTNSFRFQRRAKGRLYVWDESLPYVNPEDWGLANFTWERVGDRYYRVTLPSPGAPRSVPEALSPETRLRAQAVREALLSIRESLHPEQPNAAFERIPELLNLWNVAGSPDWGADVRRIGDRLRIETSARQWTPGAAFPVAITQPTDPNLWYWARAVLEVEEGAVSIAVLGESMNLIAERYVHRGSEEETFVPFPPEGRHVLVRNIDDNESRSIVMMRELELVTRPKAETVSV
jgi:hypothetical protein